jgi:hypothetical protein
MGLREEIQRKIEKKQQEKYTFEIQAHECGIYIASLQEVLRMLPRDAEAGKEVILRHGSLVAQARDAIKNAGKALHVTEILASVGKQNTKSQRLALSGSLAAYVRRNEIFTRPEPNTFGLVEFDRRSANAMQDEVEVTFGDEMEAKIKTAS